MKFVSIDKIFIWNLFQLTKNSFEICFNWQNILVENRKFQKKIYSFEQLFIWIKFPFQMKFDNFWIMFQLNKMSHMRSKITTVIEVTSEICFSSSMCWASENLLAVGRQNWQKGQFTFSACLKFSDLSQYFRRQMWTSNSSKWKWQEGIASKVCSSSL